MNVWDAVLDTESKADRVGPHLPKGCLPVAHLCDEARLCLSQCLAAGEAARVRHQIVHRRAGYAGDIDAEAVLHLEELFEISGVEIAEARVRIFGRPQVI